MRRVRVASAGPQEANRRTRHVPHLPPCTPCPGSTWQPVRDAGAQGAAPKLAPSAFQSAASLPSFAVRPVGPPSSSSNSAGGHVDVLRTASMPALPVVARAASDLVIIEERISLGAPPQAVFHMHLRCRAAAPGGPLPAAWGRRRAARRRLGRAAHGFPGACGLRAAP